MLFGLANLLAAVAPNIEVMAMARLIPALGLPVFWALASEAAIDLVGPEQAGRAVAKITFRVVYATAFGIPVGTLVADALGWRAAFGLLGALAFIKAPLLFCFLPSIRVHSAETALLKQFRVLRSLEMQGHVLLSILVFCHLYL